MAIEGTGPLSVDQAVSLLDSQSPQPTEAQETAETPQVAAAETEQPAREETSATEQAAEETEEQAAASEPRNPPSHWNAEERAIFAKQPPEVQDAILAQEGKREGATQKAKQEAAAARQAAEAERAAFNLRTQAIDAFLPQAVQTFQSRWSGVDWTTLADQVGGEQALKFRAQFEAERDQIQRLQSEQKRTQEEQHRQFVASESEKLKTEAPDLVDAKEGRTRMQALGNFLVSEGFPPERISLMSAKEAAIAYDAMRWREAQKRAAAQPKKPAPAVAQQGQKAPAGVRPSAASSQRSPQSARLQTLERKSRLSIAEATELQNLRGAGTTA